MTKSLRTKLRRHTADPFLFTCRSLLPGSAWGPLPPNGNFLRWQDLPSAADFSYKEIYKASRIPFSTLECLRNNEKKEIDTASARDDWTNEIRPGFVSSAKRARYIGAGNSIISSQDNLYADLNFPHVYFPDLQSHPVFRHPRQPRPTHFPGRCLVLFSMGNPYHFLFETIGRFVLARSAGLDPLGFDWFLSDPPSSSIEREVLSFLGLDFNRFIGGISDIRAHYSFDELTFSNATFGVPEELCSLVSAALDGLRPKRPDCGTPQHVYLSRGTDYKARHFANEKEVEDLLRKLGFSVILPHKLSYREQRSIFENAKVIVSAHGAALANLIWARPGTAIIELRSRSHQLGYWKLYWNISSVLQMKHYWVNCEPVDEETLGTQYAHLRVPIASLCSTTEHALQASARN